MVKNQILPNNVKNRSLIDAITNTKKNYLFRKNTTILHTVTQTSTFQTENLIRTFIMAKMFEYCNFQKDESVLVIGCLTGYSVAILSNLAGYVFGIENDKEIVDLATKNLNNLNILNCSVIYKKELSTGLTKNAPYDKILLKVL